MDNKKLMVILGKKWQDVNGNTYHTSEVISKEVNFKSDITYGYGNQFVWTAREILESEYNINIDDFMVIDKPIYVDRKRDL